MLPQCPRCKKPLSDKSLATLCAGCLNAIYMERILEREAEQFQAGRKIEIARTNERSDSGRPDHSWHLILATDTSRSYCGKRMMGKRERFPLPETSTKILCGKCEEIAARVEARALIVKEEPQ